MNDVGQQMLSGALSGLTSTLCLQPFDLLKTRVQQTDGKFAGHRPGSLQLVKEILASDGARGLWRGTTPTLFRNVPGVALYMTSLTQIRTFLATTPYFSVIQQQTTGDGLHKGSVLPKLTTQGNLLAGAIARTTVGFLANPFSVLKARFESSLHAYDSLPSAVVSLVRAGPRELFKGFVPSAMRDAPYAGIFVATYEGFKKELIPLVAPMASSSIWTSSASHVLCAASAGAVATLSTQPFDVIKTKVQVRQEDRYVGLRRTIQTIYVDRGFTGFFDGVSLRVVRKMGSSAISWAVYEALLTLKTYKGRT